MDVPIIAASLFEGDVGDGDDAINKRSSVGLADKILGKSFELPAGFKNLFKIVINPKGSLATPRQ